MSVLTHVHMAKGGWTSIPRHVRRIHGPESAGEANVVVQGHCALQFLIGLRHVHILVEKLAGHQPDDAFERFANKICAHTGVVQIVLHCHSTAQYSQSRENSVVDGHKIVAAPRSTGCLIEGRIEPQQISLQLRIHTPGHPVPSTKSRFPTSRMIIESGANVALNGRGCEI